MTLTGNNLLVSGGNTIAVGVQVAGQVTFTFANNGTIPTTALTNTVLQNITFSNAATAQVGTATHDWTFSDGSLTTTGTNQTTVTIAAAPDDGGGGGGGGGTLVVNDASSSDSTGGGSTTTPPGRTRRSDTGRRRPIWQHGQLRLSYAGAPLRCPSVL